MSEQTQAVEELIGWRKLPGRPGDFGQGEWAVAPGLVRMLPANAEDLAGWLRWRCRSVEIAWEEDDDEPEVFWLVYIVFDAPTIRSASFNAPTILAALEAAVRAVHEQETTE